MEQALYLFLLFGVAALTLGLILLVPVAAVRMVVRATRQRQVDARRNAAEEESLRLQREVAAMAEIRGARPAARVRAAEAPQADVRNRA